MEAVPQPNFDEDVAPPSAADGEIAVEISVEHAVVERRCLVQMQGCVLMLVAAAGMGLIIAGIAGMDKTMTLAGIGTSLFSFVAIIISSACRALSSSEESGARRSGQPLSQEMPAATKAGASSPSSTNYSDLRTEEAMSCGKSSPDMDPSAPEIAAPAAPPPPAESLRCASMATRCRVVGVSRMEVKRVQPPASVTPGFRRRGRRSMRAEEWGSSAGSVEAMRRIRQGVAAEAAAAGWKMAALDKQGRKEEARSPQTQDSGSCKRHKAAAASVGREGGPGRDPSRRDEAQPLSPSNRKSVDFRLDSPSNPPPPPLCDPKSQTGFSD